MNKLYKISLPALLCLAAVNAHAQDFVRMGATFDFKKDRMFQTFSFDLNRTEKVDEKKGKFFLFDKAGTYILPSVDVNIGDGVTSSENNITMQINIGKKMFGSAVKDGQNVYKLNRSIEVSPSYSSDKLFNEKLYYVQSKYIFNYTTTHQNTNTESFVDKGMSFAYGPFINLGGRSSVSYNKGDFYLTGGLVTEFKLRFSKRNDVNDGDEEPFADWLIKFSGNYYYIASDVEELNDEDFAGALKFSVDKNFYKSLYLGLTYKYGNDNPTYKSIHTLELGLRVNY